MEFGRAFSFAFDDPDWAKKLGIAALVFLIPVIGPIILMGWGLEITRRVITHDSVILPDWVDFSNYLLKGFHAFVVSLAYSLPGILLILCGQTFFIVLAAAFGDQNSNSTSGALTGIIIFATCVAVLLLAAAGFIVPAATGLLAINGSLGSAFKFNEVLDLLRADPGAYLLVLLGVFLANLLLAPLGGLVCGIGVLFTAAYTSALSGHLTGQAYLSAKAAQSNLFRK